MHRSIFESLMRTLKGHLLYQAEYLSRLLVKPPPGRSEADVLKLASYLKSLQRFQEVPQPQLVQLAKEVTYAELTAGTLVCKQGGRPRCCHTYPHCASEATKLCLSVALAGWQPDAGCACCMLCCVQALPHAFGAA